MTQRIIKHVACTFCKGTGKREPSGAACAMCTGSGQMPIYEVISDKQLQPKTPAPQQESPDHQTANRK